MKKTYTCNECKQDKFISTMTKWNLQKYMRQKGWRLVSDRKAVDGVRCYCPKCEHKFEEVTK